MKYLLVKWTIRDGENEYGEQVIVKVNRTPKNDGNLFKKVLKKFYFAEKVEKYDPINYPEAETYELDGDYRLFELHSVEEISKKRFDAIISTNLATDFHFK